MRGLLVLLWAAAAVGQTYVGCYQITLLSTLPLRVKLSSSGNYSMTPQTCNALAVSYAYFLVSNKDCFGALTTLLSSSGGNCLSCNATSPCGRDPDLAAYKTNIPSLTDVLSETVTTVTTGLFGVAISNDTFLKVPPPGNNTITAIGMNFANGTLNAFDVIYNNETAPASWATGLTNILTLNPGESIISVSLHFTNDTNVTKIDGITLKTNGNQILTLGLPPVVSDTLAVLPIVPDVTNVLVGVTTRVGDFVEQLGFSWVLGLNSTLDLFPNVTTGNESTTEPPAPTPVIFLSAGPTPCLSNETQKEFFGSEDAVGSVDSESDECKSLLAQIIIQKQAGFSWVLVGLLAGAILIATLIIIVSKFYWRDRGADYLTIVTAFLGIVEWISEALMLKSLASTEEFKLEFAVILASFIATIVINIVGNILILSRENFAPWLDAASRHRIIFYSCLGCCFFKGNAISLLASRLAYSYSKVCQLPWPRVVQLRFRALALFTVLFGSIPQLAMVARMHARLNEWTPLNALFVAFSVAGITLTVWRAFFEYRCQQCGRDKDKNLDEWDLVSISETRLRGPSTRSRTASTMPSSRSSSVY